MVWRDPRRATVSFQSGLWTLRNLQGKDQKGGPDRESRVLSDGTVACTDPAS